MTLAPTDIFGLEGWEIILLATLAFVFMKARQVAVSWKGWGGGIKES